jgi:hypothetical protein
VAEDLILISLFPLISPKAQHSELETQVYIAIRRKYVELAILEALANKIKELQKND